MGIPADPRGTRGAGHQGGRLHDLGDPQGARHPPAPDRNSTTWADFLRSQAEALLARDLFEVRTLTGAR
jgi:hypothetical protein